MTHDEALAELANIRTPIVYDAVEKFDLRPRTEGLMDTSIRSVLPSLGPLVGYAVTGKVVGELPPVAGERIVEWKEMWDYVQSAPGPTVMVAQDMDQPSARSCSWGDVAASIFLRLGAVEQLPMEVCVIYRKWNSSVSGFAHQPRLSATHIFAG